LLNYNKPTAMMLGRWQPWHKGHQELFKKTLEKTGQVVIMIRSMPQSKDNPFNIEKITANINKALIKYKEKYEILVVPNITNICYGRGVGYKIEEIILPKEIQEISATKIRKEMNEV
jgi:phosphopantetheine adenylyltransferase